MTAALLTNISLPCHCRSHSFLSRSSETRSHWQECLRRHQCPHAYLHLRESTWDETKPGPYDKTAAPRLRKEVKRKYTENHWALQCWLKVEQKRSLKKSRKKICAKYFFFSTNSINNTGNSSVFQLALRYIHWHHRYVLGLVSFIHDMNTCVCETRTHLKKTRIIVLSVKRLRCEHVSSTAQSGTKWTLHVSLIPILSKIVQSFTKIYFYSALTKDNSD